MANILQSFREGSNFKENKEVYKLTIVLDSNITTNDINTYLPNNGINYQKIEYVTYIPSNSKATILTPSTMYLCVFIAENGSINTNTKYQEGIWKCLGVKNFL